MKGSMRKIKNSYNGVKMRDKELLAALLLGVGLCFVPVLGYGEVEEDNHG